jgi:hypothetical protein
MRHHPNGAKSTSIPSKVRSLYYPTRSNKNHLRAQPGTRHKHPTSPWKVRSPSHFTHHTTTITNRDNLTTSTARDDIIVYIHTVKGRRPHCTNNANHILLSSLSIASRGRAAFSLTTATRERGQPTCYIGSAFRIRSASQKLNNIIFNSSPSNRFCRSPSPIHVPDVEDSKYRWPPRSSRRRDHSIPICRRLPLRDISPTLCFDITFRRRCSSAIAPAGGADTSRTSGCGKDSVAATSNAAK